MPIESVQNRAGALEVTHSTPFHTSNQRHKPGNITRCQTSHLSSFAMADSNTQASTKPLSNNSALLSVNRTTLLSPLVAGEETVF